MQATGIDIDGPLLRLATFKKNRKMLKLQSYKTLPLSLCVKPLYTGFDFTPLISALPSNDLMIRTFPIGKQPRRALHQALTLQAETQLHLKSEDLLTVSLIEQKAGRATTYSTTTQALQEHIAELKLFQLEPERIIATPAALKAFIQWKIPELRSYFLIDLGQTTTNCLWIEEEAVKKALTLNTGIHQLSTAFQEDRKKLISLKGRDDLDFSLLKTGQYPTLAEQARTFRRELSKQIYSFDCKRPLLVTGEFESNGTLFEFLLEGIKERIAEEVKLNLSPEEQIYALPAGLAIDYLTNQSNPLQFRKIEEQSSRTWQHLGWISAGLMATSLLLSAIFYCIGSWWIQQRETELVRNLETWVSDKDPSLRLELFAQDLNKTEELVEKWLSLIKKHDKDYPFINQAPYVSEVLNWLIRHPLVESFKLTGDPLVIQEIHYTLSSFPRLESLRDPYLAKIELEFNIANPMHARKFHEALLHDDQFVDTKHELTWEMLSDRYKTSFYLKNRPHELF